MLNESRKRLRFIPPALIATYLWTPTTQNQPNRRLPHSCQLPDSFLKKSQDRSIERHGEENKAESLSE